MSETLPRWDLPAVDFLTTDPETIKDSIISQYEALAERTLAEADPVRIFLLSVALIIIQLREEVNLAAQQNLLSYATGDKLDALGVLMDVERLPAAAAVTTLKFTLSEALGNAFVIPQGFLVTNGIVTFGTDEMLTISPGSTSGTVTATCSAPGEVGNGYLAGQLTTIVSPMVFLSSVTNLETTEGGSEEESDEDFAERIRLAPNAFSVAGPIKAYEYHAKSVSASICDVSIDSPTPGVVNVYSLVEGGVLPTSSLLEKIEAHLNDETIRPLTDEVHALAPSKKEFALCVEYYINKSDSGKASEIQTKVKAAVQKYLTWQTTKIGRDIEPNKLVSYLEQAGIGMLRSQTFSPSEHEEVSASEVAQCTTQNIHYLGLMED